MSFGSWLGVLRVALVLRRIDPRRVGLFLNTRSPYLGGRTPMQEIEEGHVERALNCAYKVRGLDNI